MPGGHGSWLLMGYFMLCRPPGAPTPGQSECVQRRREEVSSGAPHPACSVREGLAGAVRSPLLRGSAGNLLRNHPKAPCRKWSPVAQEMLHRQHQHHKNTENARLVQLGLEWPSRGLFLDSRIPESQTQHQLRNLKLNDSSSRFQ